MPYYKWNIPDLADIACLPGNFESLRAVPMLPYDVRLAWEDFGDHDDPGTADPVMQYDWARGMLKFKRRDGIIDRIRLDVTVGNNADERVLLAIGNVLCVPFLITNATAPGSRNAVGTLWVQKHFARSRGRYQSRQYYADSALVDYYCADTDAKTDRINDWLNDGIAWITHRYEQSGAPVGDVLLPFNRKFLVRNKTEPLTVPAAVDRHLKAKANWRHPKGLRIL